MHISTWQAFAAVKTDLRRERVFSQHAADVLDLGGDEEAACDLRDLAYLARADAWVPGLDEDQMWLRVTDGEGGRNRFLVRSHYGWDDDCEASVVVFTDYGVAIQPGRPSVASAIEWCERMAGDPAATRGYVAAWRVSAGLEVQSCR